jgi:cytoskeletal protein CcmA (bactofilin family)
MFSNSKNGQSQILKNTKENQVDTLIGAAATIKGDILSEGNVRVDGKFNGSIDSEKEVLIGEEACITGNITAKTIIIYGKVKGNIKSDGILEIMSTGKLYGDIDVKSISIKEGAVFQGKSSMIDKNEQTILEEAAIDKVYV